jgi:SAM-dependent methyltransferase
MSTPAGADRGVASFEVDLVEFPARADRIRYAAERFREFIGGRVLDVGCDVRVLRQLRPDIDYFGVDLHGDPDLVIDLEKTERLPFSDQSFDAVLCFEVLEHLDALHRVFGELVRVSRRHVLISLPNCWTAARRPVARGKGSIGHYGLPLERPPDRHKWFFGLSEAARFARGMSEHYDLDVVATRISEKPRPAAVRWLRRLLQPDRERYLNLYAHTLWVVFTRKIPGDAG